MLSNSSIVSECSLSKGDSEKFLTLLGGSNDKFTFAAIHDVDKNQRVHHFYGTLNEHYNNLEKLNQKGYGIFVTIQETTSENRKNKDIKRVRAIYVDVDKVGEFPKLEEFHIQPSMSVESSPGKFHHYWLIDGCHLDEFSSIQKRLIQFYPGSDEGINDLARVMRLPGFAHCKTDKRPIVQIVAFSGKKYTLPEASLPIPQAPIFDLPTVTHTDKSNLLVLSDLNIDPTYETRLLEEVDKIHEQLSRLKEGKRNDTLNKKCYYLGGLLAPYPKLYADALERTKAHIDFLIDKKGWGNREHTHETIERGFSQGRLKPTALPEEAKRSKANILLAHIASWLEEIGDIRWNEQKLRVEIDRQEVDISELRMNFQQDKDKDVGKESFQDIIVFLAKKQSYHPVREYLNSLPPCDNPQEILDNLLDVLKIETPIQRDMIKLWLIAAVARPMRPGCKVDTTLILKGGQGLHKTTFFDTLFGDGQFQTLGSHGKEADELLCLRQTWGTEFGEIETTYDKKSVGQLKNFLTKKSDTFRSPYAAAPLTHLRDFILFGTTNEDRFLPDKTGNRRYAIADIQKKIDVNYVRENRDLIWSAAKTLFDAGVPWWMSDEQEELAALNAANSEVEDLLEDKIIELLTECEYQKLTQIVEKLELPLTNQTSTRVTSILNKIGATSRQLRYNTNKGRYWRLDAHWEPTKPQTSQETTNVDTEKPSPHNADTEIVKATPQEEYDINNVSKEISRLWNDPRLKEYIYKIGLPAIKDYLATHKLSEAQIAHIHRAIKTSEDF